MKSKAFLLSLGLTVLIFFGAGLIYFFQTGFQSGDLYPEYSSLRSDPKGSMALAEAIEDLPGMSVERNFEPIYLRTTPYQETLFFLGLSLHEAAVFDQNFLEEIETAASHGARIVIAFEPSRKSRFFDPNTPIANSTNHVVNLFSHWGLSALFDDNVQEGDLVPVRAQRKVSSSLLPERLSLLSSLRLQDNGVGWQIIYEADGPCILEKPHGKGSLVLCADSFLFSNEAMLAEPEPGFLSWLIGEKSRVVFDELHLGSKTNPGVAALARRYRLHGLVFLAVGMALLFIWRHAFSFLPHPVRGEVIQVGGGRDSLGGIKNLLRRHIPAGRLLSVCLGEWKRSQAGSKNNLGPKIERMESLALEAEQSPSKQLHLLEKYQEMTRIIQNENQP